METLDISGASESTEDEDPDGSEPEPQPTSNEVAQRIVDAIEGIVSTVDRKQVRRVFTSRVEQTLGGSALDAVSRYNPDDALGREVSVRSREDIVGVTEDGEPMGVALIEHAVIRNKASGVLSVVKYFSSDPGDKAGWLPVPESEAVELLASLEVASPPDKHNYTVDRMPYRRKRMNQ